MKLLQFLIFSIFVLLNFTKSELNLDNFDWKSVKSISQTAAFRKFIDENQLKFTQTPTDKPNGRIIDGELAKPYEFPFQVGLLISHTQEHAWCSGSLITTFKVLSAASCFVYSPTVTALLGASDILHINQTIPVTDYKIHESFKSNLDNDIAILTLSREAMLNDVVKLIRLPTNRQSTITFADKIATIAGWGETGVNNSPIPNEYLRSVKAQVITNTSCLLRYPLYIKTSNLCTNAIIGTPCNGDEGGALTIIDDDRIDTQIGIFSYQFSLGCNRGWPAVYTRVTSYLNWIEENSL